MNEKGDLMPWFSGVELNTPDGVLCLAMINCLHMKMNGGFKKKFVNTKLD